LHFTKEYHDFGNWWQDFPLHCGYLPTEEGREKEIKPNLSYGWSSSLFSTIIALFLRGWSENLKQMLDLGSDYSLLLLKCAQLAYTDGTGCVVGSETMQNKLPSATRPRDSTDRESEFRKCLSSKEVRKEVHGAQ
jgi:hypothetical protein